VVEGPGPYANRSAPCDFNHEPQQKTVGDERGLFCRSIHPHESWFLHNDKGERLYTIYRAGNDVRLWYYMNAGDRDWQRFFASKLYSYIGRLRYEGFFLDNIHLSRNALLNDPDNRGGVAEYRNDDTYRAAVLGLLREVRGRIGRRPLWANLVNDPGGLHSWDPYFKYLDGIMVEDFATGWRGLEMSERDRREQLEKIRDALAKGESIIGVAQGGRNETDRLRLALAAYWLLANGRMYFRYADWKEKAYRTIWWYPEYESSPGPARGPLTARDDLWRREFQGGEVRLDLASGEGAIATARPQVSPAVQ
jgi:hypothetical protein